MLKKTSLWFCRWEPVQKLKNDISSSSCSFDRSAQHCCDYEGSALNLPSRTHFSEHRKWSQGMKLLLIAQAWWLLGVYISRIRTTLMVKVWTLWTLWGFMDRLKIASVLISHLGVFIRVTVTKPNIFFQKLWTVSDWKKKIRLSLRKSTFWNILYGIT